MKVPIITWVDLAQLRKSLRLQWCLKRCRPKGRYVYVGDGFYRCNTCNLVHPFRAVEIDQDDEGERCYITKPQEGENHAHH